MDYRLWTRIALGYLTLMATQIGVWALLAPQSFYDDYPGLGRAWVSVDGPFNEHLIRDVGALNLALAAVLLAAAITLVKELVVAAAVASLLWGVPHFLYHLLNQDGLDGTDVAASLGGLAVAVFLPIALVFVAPRLAKTPETVS